MNAPTPTNGNQSLPLALARVAELDSTPRRDPVILAPLSQKEQEEAARAVEIFRRPMLPSQLALPGRAVGNWLWHGYLGAGKLTLLTSQWKSGKTTLVSVLLARLAQAGQLAGLAVAPGRAAVVSEEDRADWDKRCRKLRIADHVQLFCRPFAARPTRAQWLGMVAGLLELHSQKGIELVVIDPLAMFLPGNSENSAREVIEGLMPLRDLTAAGMSVLLVHHPHKGRCLPGQAARGSGALGSHVDIVIEMDWVSKPDDPDRRRWLRAYSRHEETRRRLILELTPDGTDYLAHDRINQDGTEIWQVLRLILEDAAERLTQRQIQEEWPEDFRKPDQSTLSRELTEARERGRILRQGTGRKNDPYRYWLPGKEEDFHPGLHATQEQLERYQRRWQQKWFESLGIAIGDGTETRSDASTPASTVEPAAALGESKEVQDGAAAEPRGEAVKALLVDGSVPVAAPAPAEQTQASSELCRLDVAAKNDSEAETAAASEPVVTWPLRPGPAQEPVSPSQAAVPLVLSPIAVPTKEELERAAEVARERLRVRRWPHGN